MRKQSRLAFGLNLLCAVSGALAAVLFAVAEYSGSAAAKALAITAFTIFYHCIMRLAVGAAVRKIKRFNPQAKLLAAGKREMAFYKMLGFKKYKSKIPTYMPELFDAKQHTIREIAVEMCRAEIGHITIIPLSFVPLAFIPFWGAAAVFIVTSVLAAVAECVFVVLQRYNLARVQPVLLKEQSRLTKASCSTS